MCVLIVDAFSASFFFKALVWDVCSLQVHIEFTEGEDKIVLEGPTKDIQIVQSQIEAIVMDLVGTDIAFFPKIAGCQRSGEMH